MLNKKAALFLSFLRFFNKQFVPNATPRKQKKKKKSTQQGARDSVKQWQLTPAMPHLATYSFCSSPENGMSREEVLNACPFLISYDVYFFFLKKEANTTNTANTTKAMTATESCSCKLQVWCKIFPPTPQPLLLCHACLPSPSWIGSSRQVIPTWLPRCIRILFIRHARRHQQWEKKTKKE